MVHKLTKRKHRSMPSCVWLHKSTQIEKKNHNTNGSHYQPCRLHSGTHSRRRQQLTRKGRYSRARIRMKTVEARSGMGEGAPAAGFGLLHGAQDCRPSGRLQDVVAERPASGFLHRCLAAWGRRLATRRAAHCLATHKASVPQRPWPPRPPRLACVGPTKGVVDLSMPQGQMERATGEI